MFRTDVEVEMPYYSSVLTVKLKICLSVKGWGGFYNC